MKRENEKIKIDSELYDVENVYKYIKGENIDETIKQINCQLDIIINSCYKFSGRESYRTATHNTKFDEKKYNACKTAKNFRMEEWICKQCKNKTFTAVGKIKDYQVPLKSKHTKDYEGMGKIDLISQKDDVAYILEVKSPKSSEEPLKAILEIYTYWRQLGGENSQHFLNNSCLEDARILKKGIVIFENSRMHKKYLANSQKLNAIMKALDVKLFLAKPMDEIDYFIKDIIDGNESVGLVEDLKFQIESNYAEKVKTRIAKTVPEIYLNGKFRGRRYKHVCIDQKYNFIDWQFPEYCALKGNMCHDKIDYHIGIKNLNSSQAMCINFFKKFFETETYEYLFLDILRDLGLDISKELFIEYAQFEYVPNPDENTNYDFYMTLSDGRHISFEVKYTENSFGKIRKNIVSEDAYIIKWNKHYRALLDKCAYFKNPSDCRYDYNCMAGGTLNNNCIEQSNCSFYQFFDHYQICRNIAYAHTSNDIVVFLTPKENDALDDERKFIEEFAEKNNTKNIVNLYWEPLINRSILRANTNDLREYLEKFRDKYFTQYFNGSQNRCVIHGGLDKHYQSLEDDFVVVEIATSGDNSESDEIVKLSAVKIDNMTIQDTMELYIKPQNTLADERKELLGITEEQLEKSYSIDAAIDAFNQWNTSKNIVQYHHEYNRCFFNNTNFQSIFENCVMIDAQALMKNMFYTTYEDRVCSFSAAYQFLFGIEAVANAENEAKLFIELLSRLKFEYSFSVLNDIETYWHC